MSWDAYNAELRKFDPDFIVPWTLRQIEIIFTIITMPTLCNNHKHEPKRHNIIWETLKCELTKAGWTLHDDCGNGATADVCSINVNSNIKHHVTQNITSRWHNKLQFYARLKQLPFIPKTFTIINNVWLNEKPTEEGIYFIKNPSSDNSRGNR